MAPTETTRLGVYIWSSGGDEFTRDQMTDSHQRLEDRVALFLSGTFAARPAAGSTNARGFYLATDQNILYYSDGSNWYSVNSFSNPVAINPGDSNTAGVSTFAARADHKHALPDWGVVGELVQIGTTAAAGSTAKFARIDHRHTLASGSVTAGTIAAGAVNNSNIFTTGVVGNTAIADGAITKGKLSTDQQTPAGAIMAYGGTTAPTGWLLCDGSSYDTSVYGDLFSAIGYRYGGSASNFNVPDLRNRVPRGASSAGASVSSTSTDEVSIGENNLPAHTHDVSTLNIANHANHVHANGGGMTNSLSTHDHQFSHTHGGYVLNGGVGSSGAFGVFYVPAEDGEYSMFFGGGGPQVNLGSAGLLNGTTTTTSQSTTTTGPSANLSHNHALTGNTGNPTTTLSHSVSGSTGNNTTTQTPLSVVPRHQTVNYIIKT